MPRMPRRDAPGALHHVTLRGVAQCNIFADDSDRASLFARMTRISRECRLPFLAFAFMPNHIHVVARTGPIPLAVAMARIATGHALYFNRRHQRVGHLFQNRYKARPIEGDAHLRNAIRYVHANPLASKLVSSLTALDTYEWTGHAQLAAKHATGMLDRRAALAVFGECVPEARRELRRFMREWRVEAPKREGAALTPLRLPQLEAEIERAARAFGVPSEAIVGGSRRREACRARAEVAHAAVAVHRLPAREVALRLGVTHAAVLRGAARAGLRCRAVP